MSRISKILRGPVDLVKRYQRETSKERRNPRDWKYKMKNLGFNLAGYNKYGLYTDDVRDFDNTVVLEALRRLPKDVLDARNFRLIRAMQLDALKMYLPEEKWITYEQDMAYRYLHPYIQEVVAERNEIYEFGCTNYAEDHWPQGEVK